MTDAEFDTLIKETILRHNGGGIAFTATEKGWQATVTVRGKMKAAGYGASPSEAIADLRRESRR